MPNDKKSAVQIVANLASEYYDKHHEKSYMAPVLMVDCGMCLVEALESYATQEREEQRQAINIIFDGPPSHQSGRFVEVETDDGKSIKVGEWIERSNGCWVLRIAAAISQQEEK